MHVFGIGFVIFLGLAALVFITLCVNTYNGLVSLKKQCERAWANIDVILKQRFDLIPQLVQICEQFVTYENDILKRLVDARTRYGQAGTQTSKIQASGDLTQAVRGMLAIGEAYPVLKSSEQFVQIQNTLSTLENQLADRRELYNDSATNFNTRIEQIPDVFFARMLQYSSVELFKVTETEKTMPSLKIKTPAS
jgi:LemA protein